MKNLKLTSFLTVLFGALLFLTSCGNDDDTVAIDQQLLISKWTLTGLVNISDEHKYLNAVLEFSNDNTYTHTEASGVSSFSGTWKSLNNENIQLSLGLFEGETLDLRLKDLTSNSLILEEHYTAGGKDAYLEYHYTRTN